MKNFSFLAFAVFALTVETIWAQPNNPASWNPLAEGGALVELALDTVSPAPGWQGTNTLRITVKKTGERFGVVCADMGKMKLSAGQWYDLSFNARTDPPKTFALVVSLESQDGQEVFARTTLPEVGGPDWGRFSVALHVRQPAKNCRLVIALADTGTLWLNDLSVVLRKTTGTR
jgi:hypothetical protein